MVLLLCLWDNLKFWRIFSLGSKEGTEAETGSVSSFRATTSYYCDESGGGGDAITPFTLPSNTSATAKVSCSSYYTTCEQNKSGLSNKHVYPHKSKSKKRPPDELWTDEEEDDSATCSVDKEVSALLVLIDVCRSEQSSF